MGGREVEQGGKRSWERGERHRVETEAGKRDSSWRWGRGHLGRRRKGRGEKKNAGVHRGAEWVSKSSASATGRVLSKPSQACPQLI